MLRLAAALLAAPLLLFASAPAFAQAVAPAPSGYDALVTLYKEFRAFVPPAMVKGVPDYSPAAMARHYAELQRFQARLKAIDDSGWAIRLGMALTIIGAFTGGMMTRPSGPQLAAARDGERMTIAGSHTVGGPDGGPGMAGTGWSRNHGDLRVSHFVGLHAMQVLPILALLLRRRGYAETSRVRLVIVAAASYAALFGILLVQALRGIPIAAPDTSTMVQLGAWALATVLAGLLTRFDVSRAGRGAVTI
jgi:hypothetical protein